MPAPTGNQNGRVHDDAKVAAAIHAYVDDCLRKNKVPFAEMLAELARVNTEIYGRLPKGEYIYTFTASERNPLSKAARKRLKRVQKYMLKNGGLEGVYNSTIAKLLLDANHGVRETRVSKNEHTGKNGAPLLSSMTDQELKDLAASHGFDKAVENEPESK